MKEILDFIERKPLYALLFLMTGVLFFVFKDFIFLNKVYLFNGAGCDTFNYSYPHFVHISEYLKNTGIPQWSFQHGMGQNIFSSSITDPFSFLIYLKDKDNIPYTIVFVEILKILLIGIIFFFYLKGRNTTSFASIVGALLIAFCGYVLLQGTWYDVFTVNAVYVIFLLFSFEKLLKDGVWYWFPVCIALIGSLQIFYLVMDCELLLLYSVFRFIEEKGYDFKGLGILLSKLSFLGLLGILIGSVCLLPGVKVLLDSPRVGGNISQFHTLISSPMFRMDSSDNLTITLLRMFSTDIFGADVKSTFKYDPRYLERNVSYCGLLPLLLLPQVFYFLDKRKKIIYGCVLSLFALAFIFPFFRYTFWFFSGDYFRLFSFCFAIFLIYFSIQALNQIDKQSKIHAASLIITSILLIVLVNYNYTGGDGLFSLIDKKLKITITYYLVGYSILIYLLTFPKWKSMSKLILLACIAFELVSFSRNTVNERSTFNRQMLEQRGGFNDYTNEAVAYIDSTDKSFFRITRDYMSGYNPDGDLNTPQFQGYKGTTFYSSFFQPSYFKFLFEMGIDSTLHDAAYCNGLNYMYILQTWGGVKYYLVKPAENKSSIPTIKSLGYDSINKIADVVVFKNKFSLPLGYTYKNIITYSEFKKANFLQKNKILLNGFVINDEDKEKYAGFSVLKTDSFKADNILLDEYFNPLKELRKDTLTISQFAQNSIQGNISLKEKRMLFFSIPYDDGWKATVDGKEEKLDKVNIGFTGLLLDKGSHEVLLQFEPPFLKAGAFISLAGLLLFGFLFWKFRNTSFFTIGSSIPILITRGKNKIQRKK